METCAGPGRVLAAWPTAPGPGESQSTRGGRLNGLALLRLTATPSTRSKPLQTSGSPTVPRTSAGLFEADDAGGDPFFPVGLSWRTFLSKPPPAFREALLKLRPLTPVLRAFADAECGAGCPGRRRLINPQPGEDRGPTRLATLRARTSAISGRRREPGPSSGYPRPRVPIFRTEFPQSELDQHSPQKTGPRNVRRSAPLASAAVLSHQVSLRPFRPDIRYSRFRRPRRRLYAPDAGVAGPCRRSLPPAAPWRPAVQPGAHGPPASPS